MIPEYHNRKGDEAEAESQKSAISGCLLVCLVFGFMAIALVIIGKLVQYLSNK